MAGWCHLFHGYIFLCLYVRKLINSISWPSFLDQTLSSSISFCKLHMFQRTFPVDPKRYIQTKNVFISMTTSYYEIINITVYMSWAMMIRLGELEALRWMWTIKGKGNQAQIPKSKIWYICEAMSINIILRQNPEEEFVTPVTHGGSVKFLASGVNFSRNNAIYNIN